MEALNVIERIFAGLSQTPVGVLALLILLVWAITPIALVFIVWRRDSKKGGDALANGLIKIMGDTNQDIAENVKLSRQAIEKNGKDARDAAKAITDAATLLSKRHEDVLAAIQGEAAQAEGRQTVVLDRLDILNALMQDTVQQFMEQFNAHEDHAAERDRVLLTTIEVRFGELLAELRTIRDSVVTATPSGDGAGEPARAHKEE